MKALNIFLGLSLLFALSTCTKFGKNVTVKGRVLNPLTGEGIAGEEVWLMRTEYFQLPGGGKIIKKATTDANGNFELSKFTLSHPTFKVALSGKYYGIGWWKGNEYAAFQEIAAKIGKTMKMEYHAVPYGTIRMHVKNINCQGGGDSLNIFFDGSEVINLNNIQDANNKIGNILYAPITGCWDVIDGGIKVQTGKRFYHWTVKRGSNIQTFYDTINVIPNSTVTLNVFY